MTFMTFPQYCFFFPLIFWFRKPPLWLHFSYFVFFLCLTVMDFQLPIIQTLHVHGAGTGWSSRSLPTLSFWDCTVLSYSISAVHQKVLPLLPIIQTPPLQCPALPSSNNSLCKCRKWKKNDTDNITEKRSQGHTAVQKAGITAWYIGRSAVHWTEMHAYIKEIFIHRNRKT